MLDKESGIFSAIVEAPFGAVGIRCEDQAVTELVYLPPRFQEKAAADKTTELAVKQVLAYLHDPDYQFSLPLKPAGTAFQGRVWQAISSIPRGQVLTYGQSCQAFALCATGCWSGLWSELVSAGHSLP